MSISVDDLVASMSSNHIGQEAMDLAALQAQLRQTLYSQPMPAPATSHRGAHANTPISCTPTSSSFWDRPDFDRRRSNSVASMSSRHESEQREYESVDNMDEDEQMVEDMLFSSSNATSYPASQMPPPSPTLYATRHSRKSSVSSPFSNTHYDVPPANNSLFATTDPFYLAQLQAAAQNTAPPSFFSQFGNPSQQSPFLKGHPFAHRQNASEIHPSTAFVR